MAETEHKVLKLFVPERFPGFPLLPITSALYGEADQGNTLFTRRLPDGYRYEGFVFVPSAEEADAILAPHPISVVNEQTKPYIDQMRSYARETGKKLILFIGSDLSHDIHVDGVLALKGSQYGYLSTDSEFTVVPFAEDLSQEYPLMWRTKGEKATISFCGWAGFAGPSSYIKYIVRLLQVELVAFLSGREYLNVRKKGLYWRRRAMRALSADNRIQTSFIVRKTFSASAKTISIDPETARREYVTNIAESDFVLTPKGDGNFSVRFYEALSLGRIPVLVDTDMCLPLEHIVPYESFVIRVPYTEIDRIADIVADTYQKLSDEEFIAMQKAARHAYETWLRYDRFYKFLFSEVLLPLVSEVPVR